jgi:hypothetical protein
MDIETSAVISQRAMIVNPTAKQHAAEHTRTQKSTDTESKNNAPSAIRRDVDERIYAQAERFAQEQNTFYDQPNRHSRDALHAYQQMQSKQNEKDHIRQMLGVDTFA